MATTITAKEITKKCRGIDWTVQFAELISSWICPMGCFTSRIFTEYSRASHTEMANKPFFNIFCKYLFHTNRKNIILNTCLIKWKQQRIALAIINFLAKIRGVCARAKATKRKSKEQKHKIWMKTESEKWRQTCARARESKISAICWAYTNIMCNSVH